MCVVCVVCVVCLMCVVCVTIILIVSRINFSVPLGSRSSLKLFVWCFFTYIFQYTTSLNSVFKGHNLDNHFYADDTQICICGHTCSLLLPKSALGCLQGVSLLMKNSKLRLNADKTEFLVIGVPTQRRKNLLASLRHIC